MNAFIAATAADFFDNSFDVARLLAVSGFIAAALCLALRFLLAEDKKQPRRAATHQAPPAATAETAEKKTLANTPPATVNAGVGGAISNAAAAHPLRGPALRDFLRDPRAAKTAFVLSEVLSPPVSLRTPPSK